MIATHPARQGFTLIEVLTSMTLGLIILLLAIAMLGRTGDDYERLGDNVRAGCEARAALAQLTADLNTARYHKDCLFHQSQAPWPRDRLGFLSLQAPAAQSSNGCIGDLCAIHYYLDDLVINGKTVRCLMRGFRESNDTFNALHRNQIPTLFSHAENDEPIAFGVLAFEARPLPCNPSCQQQDVKNPMLHAPQAVSVRLVIARRELAGKLHDAAAWDGCSAAAKWLGAAPQAGANRNLEVFSTFIRFGNHDNL